MAAEGGTTRRKRGKKKKLLRSGRANVQAKYERYRREDRRIKNKVRRQKKIERGFRKNSS